MQKNRAWMEFLITMVLWSLMLVVPTAFVFSLDPEFTSPVTFLAIIVIEIGVTCAFHSRRVRGEKSVAERNF